jgi:hypothetical protein
MTGKRRAVASLQSATVTANPAMDLDPRLLDKRKRSPSMSAARFIRRLLRMRIIRLSVLESSQA